MNQFNRSYGLAVVLFLLVGMTLGRTRTAAAEEPLVVFLVRHAEKIDTSTDAKLSGAGRKRAQELAMALRDSGVTQVHSTDFIRTRNTAAPTAARLGLNVQLYNRLEMAALVERMRNAGGRHLVVGHSNTTPNLVRLLGGNPGSIIKEDGEYDRLYIVTFDTDGNVSTILMRYGLPFAPNDK